MHPWWCFYSLLEQLCDMNILMRNPANPDFLSVYRERMNISDLSPDEQSIVRVNYCVDEDGLFDGVVLMNINDLAHELQDDNESLEGLIAALSELGYGVRFDDDFYRANVYRLSE